MQNPTRLKFNAYVAAIAALNGVASATEAFTIAPSVQQTLETKVQESSAFLSAINMIGVREMQGAKLGLGTNGTIASRTNTANADRVPRDVSAIDGTGYQCYKTDFDTAIPYALLDAWAKFPDFQTRLRDVIVKQQALDRLMIGFNGVTAAADTNRALNPLLQDVNIGWLQILRTQAPTRVMDHGAAAGTITVGANGDYTNLDALVYDAYQTMVDPWHREAPGLVAIVGRGLMHDKLFPLVSDQSAPTEQLAADIVRSQRRLGGLPGISAPFMPANTVLVTSLDNLSIYWQESARRRHVIDNPRRDRIENFESSNDAYVVEDFGKCVLIEKIDLLG